MRTSSFDGATIEYPDLIAFAFNPIIINLYGKNYEFVEISVEDTQTGVVYQDNREMFGESVFLIFHLMFKDFLMLEKIMLIIHYQVL